MVKNLPAVQEIPAAATKSLQSCPTLCDPTDGSLPGSSVPGILLARILEPWVGKNSLEKGMATHCSIPAWRIPWTEEPGRLQSMGSHRAER